MAIGWSSDLATGVEAIDNQHREIFNRVDRLSAACSEGKGKDEVLRLLLFLEGYVKEHFAAEERLQLRHAYPKYDAHKSQHARFITDLARLTGEFKAVGATLSLVIMANKTLTSWLVQHIAGTDTEFARYLREEAGA
ncbi:MAG: hemerythrin [Geobacteraceae bacterium GWC2_58_44]|nr:MAG: hemerythrin [Geobacteraceae bacterium GWC2_58_44]HBG05831.1 hemerythrin [Geobacter sp.]